MTVFFSEDVYKKIWQRIVKYLSFFGIKGIVLKFFDNRDSNVLIGSTEDGRIGTAWINYALTFHSAAF